MNSTLFFNLVFIAQILGLSLILPRFLLLKNIKDTKNDKPIIARYELMNKVNLIIGLLVLAFLSFHPVFASVEFTLMALGGYFLLQILPVIINRQLLETAKVYTYHDDGAFALNNVVHPFVIGIAVILFLSYLIKSLIGWDVGLNTQLLQMLIFSGVNVFLILTLATIYQKINQTSGEEVLKQKAVFSKAAPLFTYFSIGISIYNFGKMLIFNYELNEFRPVMMSMAFIAVGFALFSTIAPKSHKDMVNSIKE